MSDVVARQARGGDIAEIRDIFVDAYGQDYPYQYFFDEEWLKRSVYSDDLVMVVAEDTESGAVLGTGSVVFDVGAYSDLIGEFGRLAVHKKARGRGIGKLIMAHRIRMIEDRLHVAVVDNRTNHFYSQKISVDFQFAPVGLLPLKHRFRHRESIAMFARHFGPALELRRNHPRVVPEVARIAHLAMKNLKIESDVIVDESTPVYPTDDDFEVSTIDTEGFPSLLRIERGRVKDRAVFGPMRLQYGFFKLADRQADYLVARRPGAPQEAVAGAIGFLHDDFENNLRIFELIAATDDAIRHLFKMVLERARRLGVEYIEIEVSAHATALQRTLIEMGFLPAAYIPAMVFHDVERLDVVKMVRLLVEPTIGDVELVDSIRPLCQTVVRSLETQAVIPKIEDSIERLRVFEQLDEEQARRLASAMSVENYESGQHLFDDGEEADELFVMIEGTVEVIRGDGVSVGTVAAGEVVGENAMLSESVHSVTARANGDVGAAVLSRHRLRRLARQRPDIALVLYRNLAISLGEKLRRVDAEL